MKCSEPMAAAVASDYREVTVQTMQLVPDGVVVCYASVPQNFKTSTTDATQRMENRHRLVTVLWEHLRAQKSFNWKYSHCSNQVACPIQLIHNPLGQPNLLFGKNRGPSISFTTAGEEVWAAIAGDDSDIGIDVAGRAEFGATPSARRAAGRG